MEKQILLAGMNPEELITMVADEVTGRVLAALREYLNQGRQKTREEEAAGEGGDR